MSNKISGRGAREGKGLISRANAAAKKRPKAASKVTKKTSAGSNPVVPVAPRSKNPVEPVVPVAPRSKNPVEPVVPVAPRSKNSKNPTVEIDEDWAGAKAGYYSTAARNARKAVKKAIPNKKKLRSDIQASIYKDKPTF